MPTFNLFDKNWITVERMEGGLERVGIMEAILASHTIRAVADPSPLASASVLRLLIAILQEVVAPQKKRELQDLWKQGNFEVYRDRLEQFRQTHAERFDLFSERPFMQSADFPPVLEDKKLIQASWPITGLHPHIPVNSARVLFHSGLSLEPVLCPACVAVGLLIPPMFATALGAGKAPSINGKPPIYLFPAGKNLFQMLAASILLADNLPAEAEGAAQVFWKRPDGVVLGGKNANTVSAVSYTGGLLFLARKVRVYPVERAGVCEACGEPFEIGVERMLFGMGEYYKSEQGSPWRDPFVAYLQSKKGNPYPVCLDTSKTHWLEYAHLTVPTHGLDFVLAPTAILQRYTLGLFDDDDELLNCRAIALASDQAKKFLWFDNHLVYPAELLDNLEGQEMFERGLSLVRALAWLFFKIVDRRHHSYRSLAESMREQFWSQTALQFRYFVLRVGKQPEEALEEWKGSLRRSYGQAVKDTLDNCRMDFLEKARLENILFRAVNRTLKGDKKA